MIRNFENTNVLSEFPPECVKSSNLSGIKAIFFLNRSFSFSSISDFQDVDIWIQAIKDGDIIPLFDAKDFQDNSDPDPIEANGQNYLYVKYKGKYKFIHVFDYTYDFAKNLKPLNQSDFDYIFLTKTNQIVAYSPDGVSVQGFETDSIIIEKMQIGTAQAPNAFKINVELTDPDQLDLNAEIFSPEWSPSRNLRLVEVQFSEIELTSLKFKISDATFGKPIVHLRAPNFIIDDSGGIITFSEFLNLGEGYYYLNGFSSPPGSGEIVIDSKIYYGSGAYGSSAVATLNNFGFAITGSGGHFVVQVLDSDTNPITGKSIGDFSFDAGTISSFVDKGNGVYFLYLTKGSITTGTIYFDDGNYAGNTAYDFTAKRIDEDNSVLRLDALGKYWPYLINGASLEPGGTYQPESGAWRIITSIGGDFLYVYWNKILNGATNRISINIEAISAGEIKFQNGSNVQAYTTSGIKTFDWTGDGSNLTMFTNAVNCRLSDFSIEII